MSCLLAGVTHCTTETKQWLDTNDNPTQPARLCGEKRNKDKDPFTYEASGWTRTRHKEPVRARRWNKPIRSLPWVIFTTLSSPEWYVHSMSVQCTLFPGVILSFYSIINTLASYKREDWKSWKHTIPSVLQWKQLPRLDTLRAYIRWHTKKHNLTLVSSPGLLLPAHQAPGVPHRDSTKALDQY